MGNKQNNIVCTCIRKDNSNSEIILGTYLIDSQLGEGSYGVVYKCLDTKLKSFVAVKTINFTKAVRKFQNVDKFLEEAEMLLFVRSPYVMRLYEYKILKDNIYLICEFIEGKSMSVFYEGNLRISEESVKMYMQKILTGVNHMHSKKVMHRDLKLENLLFTTNSENELEDIKIVDLGLASYTDNFIQGVCGTPVYMAPEMLRREDYNSKFDVWCLGIILYVLLFNQFPFYHLKMMELAMMILTKEYVIPENTDISPEAQEVLSMCLKKDPIDRATCEELLTHPWLQNISSSSKTIEFTQIESSNQEELEKYSKKNKLLKGIKMFLCRFDNKNTNNQVLKNLFLKYDENASGKIDLLQFGKCLEELKIDIEIDEVIEIFNNVDLDGNGSLDYDEFISALRDNRHMVDYIYMNWMFSHLDKDDKGYIKKTDIEKFLELNSVRFDKVDIVEIFDELDIEGKGKITHQDFDDWIKTIATELDKF